MSQESVKQMEQCGQNLKEAGGHLEIARKSADTAGDKKMAQRITKTAQEVSEIIKEIKTRIEPRK